MTTGFLLAPGPSASAKVADQLRGCRLGVCTSAFPLAPWAEFLVATDLRFWANYPGAKDFAGEKFTVSRVNFAERVHGSMDWNSGVLGLEVWRKRGATRVVLVGFDFGLGHYFGSYGHGLSNTTADRRRHHARQFRVWNAAHGRKVEVLNATPGSLLDVFPHVPLESVL